MPLFDSKNKLLCLVVILCSLTVIIVLAFVYRNDSEHRKTTKSSSINSHKIVSDMYDVNKNLTATGSSLEVNTDSNSIIVLSEDSKGKNITGDSNRTDSSKFHNDTSDLLLSELVLDEIPTKLSRCIPEEFVFSANPLILNENGNSSTKKEDEDAVDRCVEITKHNEEISSLPEIFFEGECTWKTQRVNEYPSRRFSSKIDLSSGLVEYSCGTKNHGLFNGKHLLHNNEINAVDYDMLYFIGMALIDPSKYSILGEEKISIENESSDQNDDDTYSEHQTTVYKSINSKLYFGVQNNELMRVVLLSSDGQDNVTIDIPSRLSINISGESNSVSLPKKVIIHSVDPGYYPNSTPPLKATLDIDPESVTCNTK